MKKIFIILLLFAAWTFLWPTDVQASYCGCPRGFQPWTSGKGVYDWYSCDVDHKCARANNSVDCRGDYTGWDGCYWYACSGSYSACTASCDGGTQYDTGCGNSSFNDYSGGPNISCNTQACCPATVNITGSISGAPGFVKACTNTNVCTSNPLVSNWKMDTLTTSSSNLALNKTTFASGNAAGASAAVDGNTGTGWNSGGFPNQWITVDLGASVNINEVKMLPGGYPTGTVYYNVLVSNDNTNFTTVVSGAVANSAGTWGDNFFPQTSARYIRILATNWATSWVYISEFQVYNSGSTPDSAGSNTGYVSGATLSTGQKIVNSLNFNGSTNFVDLGSNFSSLTNNFSVSFWVNTGTSQMAYADIFGNHAGGGGTNGLGFVQNNTTLNQYFFVYGNGASWITSNTVQLNPGWKHVVITKDSNNCFVYVNGVANTPATCNTNITSSSMNLRLGQGYYYGGRFFKGSIDEFAIWNKVLSQPEITTLYNSNIYSPSAYSLTVPTNTTYTITGDTVTGYNVSYSPNQSAVAACSNLTGPTITYTVCTPQCTGKCGGTDSCGGTCPDNCILPQTCGALTPNVCGYTGPNSAGIVQSAGTINAGSGKISQNGATPGFRQSTYTNIANLSKINYTTFLAGVYKNSGLTHTFLQNYFDTTGAVYGPVTSGSNQYRFWRISSAVNENLNTILGSIIASADTTSIHVIIPQDAFPPAALTISTAKAIVTNKKIVAFVPGSLAVSANITVDTGSSAVFILDSPGDLTLDPAVTRLDGVYVFPGTFDDGTGPLQLTGYGSLLATGPADLGFNRYFYPGPAEQWFYQPKYLSIYKNVLAVSTYTFAELPPQ